MKMTVKTRLGAAVCAAVLTAQPAMAQDGSQDVTVSANLVDPAQGTQFEVIAEPDFGTLVRPISGSCEYRLIDGELAIVDGDDGRCAASGTVTFAEAQVACPEGSGFILSGGNITEEFVDGISVGLGFGTLSGSAVYTPCSALGEKVQLFTLLAVTPDASLGQMQLTVPVELFLD